MIDDMFTGIIHEIGSVKEVRQGRLTISAKQIARQVKLGSSVAVNGVCLTVEKKSAGALQFAVMPETLRKTTLGKLSAGDRVNLEPSLRAGDEIGGHFVYGHVDGMWTVKKTEHDAASLFLTIAISNPLRKYLAPQGSIAIDGVSLTIARLDKQTCTVSLVDYTLKHTTLGHLMKGDRVNVECDMIAKCVSQIRNPKHEVRNKFKIINPKGITAI